MPELLPCPFCAENVKVVQHISHNDYQVRCHNCGALGPKPYGTRDDAIQDWNTRADFHPVSDPKKDAEARRG